MSFEGEQQETKLMPSAANEQGHSWHTWRSLRVLLLALVAMACGFWLGNDWLTTAELQRDAPGLYIPDASLYIGDVWPQKAHEWTLPITNTTDHTVRVLDIQMQCGCSTITPSTIVLAPGNSKEIHLSMDLSLDRLRLTESPHHFESPIVARLDAAPWFARWTIRGTVHSPVVVSATALRFQNALVGAKHNPAQILDIRSLYDHVKLVATSRSPMLKTQLKRSPVSGRLWNLIIRPTERLTAGRHELAVGLFLNLPDSAFAPGLPSQATIEIPVIVHGYHDVRPSQDTLYLGSGRLGETLTGDVTLIATHHPFEIMPVQSAQHKSVTILPKYQSGALHRTFGVRVTVAATRHHRVQVTFRVRQAAQQSSSSPAVYDLPVMILYDGVQN